MVQARDLEVGTMYKLANTLRIRSSSPAYLQRLTNRHHRLLRKTAGPDNSFLVEFQTDNMGEFPNLNPTFWVYEDQQFILPQKSISNVYRNKGTEYGVRNMFERTGTTGYNPAANMIVKQATGVKYTPNPYLPGGKHRSTRKHKHKRKSKKTRKY